jgi:hypothetical protein
MATQYRREQANSNGWKYYPKGEGKEEEQEDYIGTAAGPMRRDDEEIASSSFIQEGLLAMTYEGRPIGSPLQNMDKPLTSEDGGRKALRPYEVGADALT